MYLPQAHVFRGAIHSRLHKVPRNRSPRPDPMADMNSGGLLQAGGVRGDDIVISTPKGSITVKVHPTLTVPEGLVNMFHGYSEADAEYYGRGPSGPVFRLSAYRSTYRLRSGRQEVFNSMKRYLYFDSGKCSAWVPAHWPAMDQNDINIPAGGTALPPHIYHGGKRRGPCNFTRELHALRRCAL